MTEPWAEVRGVVINDVKLIEEEASKLGLRLNRSKSELIRFDHTT